MSRAERTVPGQTAAGLALAALVIGGWAALHLWAVFLFRPEGAGWLLAPLLIALLTWLSVGLFITAHDAMHGSLAAARARASRAWRRAR